jgi:CBS domain-containing protein
MVVALYNSIAKGAVIYMQLKEFINYRVEVVHPNDTLQHAAEKMKDLDVGSMPVCEGQHLVGMLTDRDITIRATAKGQDPTKTEVRDVMTADVLYCFENQDVEEAARMMQENQIRRLFVLNEDEELVGITSLGELATITGDRAMAGETLERISEPTEPGSFESEPEAQEGTDEEDPSAELRETRVTGLFHDRETAKKAIDELNAAGFSVDSIAVAMDDESEQDNFMQEAQVSAVPSEILPSLPDLPVGSVLVVVEAEDRAAEALEILNRYAVPGGVRMPTD